MESTKDHISSELSDQDLSNVLKSPLVNANSLDDLALREKITNFKLEPLLLDSKLRAYGPYVRVYDRGKHSAPVENKTKSFKTKKENNVKYTSIIDVSSNREKLYKKEYPTVIKVPSTITKVVVGSMSPDGSSYLRAGVGAPSTITLHRPSSSKRRYVRSATNLSVNAFLYQSNPNIEPSVPLLPFLTMTNSLQLHFQLNILAENERIIEWNPGTFLIQSSPLIPSPPPKSIFSFFKNTPKQLNLDKKKPLNYPCYLLLTNKSIYICQPLFRLGKLKTPICDEQTTYKNPENLLKISYKLSLNNIFRMDVGPGRQYLAIHSNEYSIIYQCRIKSVCSRIIDCVMTLNDDGMNTFINQDLEWFTKYVQTNILIRPGIKDTTILSYEKVWDDSNYCLTIDEYDSGINEEITKVDFDFVKLFISGVLLRYIKPLQDSDCRSVEIIPMSVLQSREYFYVLQERLDVWPPSVFPPEYNVYSNRTELRGFLCDLVSPCELLGVGRLSDITRIEKWRSWRIDSTFGTFSSHFKGLGASLQNGHIGYLNSSTIKTRDQQASAAGWFWWIRISFGDIVDMEIPHNLPKSVPEKGYWWDLAFGSRESCDDFIQSILSRYPLIPCIIGDD